MSALGALLGFVLLLFLIVLIVRAVLDWAGALTPGGGGWVGAPRELSHRLTEPVIAPVRRVLKPVRIGDVQLDRYALHALTKDALTKGRGRRGDGDRSRVVSAAAPTLADAPTHRPLRRDRLGGLVPAAHAGGGGAADGGAGVVAAPQGRGPGDPVHLPGQAPALLPRPIWPRSLRPPRSHPARGPELRAADPEPADPDPGKVTVSGKFLPYMGC